MKKLLNYFLMLLVLLSMTGCSMELIKNNCSKGNSIGFNFRSPSNFNGCTMNLSIMDGDVCIDNQSKTLSSEKLVTFNIDGIPLNTKVVVKVTIEDKDKILRYSAEKDYIITDAKNSILINLNEFTEFGNIIIIPSISVEMWQVNNFSFGVTYDGKTYKRPIEVTEANPEPTPEDVAIDLGYNEITSKPIYAKIYDERTEGIMYEYEGILDPISGKNVIKLERNPGYFTWKKSGNYSYFLRSYEKRPNIININHPALAHDTVVRDSAINDKYITYVIGNGLVNNPLFVIPSGGMKPQELIIDNLQYVNFDTLNTIYAFGNNFLIGGEKFYIDDPSTGAGKKYPVLFSIPYNNSLHIQMDKDYSNSLHDSGIGAINEIALDGNTIYIANNTRESNEVGGFNIYKGTVNEGSGSIDNLALYKTSDLFPELSNSRFMIKDMCVLNGTLYALVLDATVGPMMEGDISGTNSNSRGGLLVLNGSSDGIKFMSKSTRLNPVKPDPSDKSPSAGDYIYMLKQDSPELKNCLIGPRKFIATTPKKLIIADCGAVYDGTIGNNLKKLKKRIVTIDVDSFLMENVDVDASMFDGKFGGSASNPTNTYVAETEN